VKTLGKSETELEGKWIVEEGQVRADAICDRIEWLIANHLKKMGGSRQSGGWETLFQDPNDGRFWEKTYPLGGMHGGGPPMLCVVTEEQAHSKYDFS
jgi:hypothetical protein